VEVTSSDGDAGVSSTGVDAGKRLRKQPMLLVKIQT